MVCLRCTHPACAGTIVIEIHVLAKVTLPGAVVQNGAAFSAGVYVRVPALGMAVLRGHRACACRRPGLCSFAMK